MKRIYMIPAYENNAIALLQDGFFSYLEWDYSFILLFCVGV